jgi:aubergine-like protein
MMMIIFVFYRLCTMTGLSDEQRANFKLMKAVGDYTRTAPIPRIAALQKFAKRLATTPEVNEELMSWNMKFSGDLERIKGRTFAPETIMQGQGKKCSYQLDNADWGNAFRDFKLFGAVNCTQWIVIYSERKLLQIFEIIYCIVDFSTYFFGDLNNFSRLFLGREP